MRWRYDVKTELALAFLPTITVVLVLLLIESFSHQRLLFASLASSAFLIYLDPRHEMNNIKTLSISQTSAALLGFVVYLAAGSGYDSAAIAMILSIAVMIFLKAMHPPAVSTALSFAFREADGSNLLLFLTALSLLVVLIVLQRISIWLIRKEAPKIEDKIE
ncbi:HPP family protein [Aridibaculum aurantiacum]|uniref:HPP family protein n=1 Tax=Aridibaculum aurantiacum TaxID=2810307 RepID=UPI001A966E3B|nr:HPP family protein [Aridibaculum aurantiacum]